MYDKLINELKAANIITDAGTINPAYGKIFDKNKNIYDSILLATTFLDADYTNPSIIQRLRTILLNIKKSPICKNLNCANVIKFNSRKKYAEYCSTKCVATDKAVRQKTKVTNLQRYGGAAPACSQVVTKKTKQTKKKKYGDCNYNNREAAKQTSLARFGVEFAQQTNEIKQKTKETNNMLYGGDAPACSIDVIHKMQITCNEKFGASNIMQTEIGKLMYKNAFVLKHGVENPQQLQRVQDATRITTNKKYDVDFFSQQHISQESLDKLNNEEWLYDQHVIQKLPGNYISEYLGVTPRTVYLRLKKFNIPIQNFYSSIVERHLVDFISSYYKDEIITNSKAIIAPYELDIFLPSLNIAIEFNGIYWHGEQQGKDKNYHLNKTQMCKDKGISLIHIREDQWENKKEIVKSIILSKMRMLPNKLDARKCVVSKTSVASARNFLNENHIQGNANTSINIGLFSKDELVSVMTFSKSRYDKTSQYELVRFASLINTNVRGAATKLFSYFIREYSPETVISYSDMSRNNGNVYIHMGFKFSHQSPPGFGYVHPNKKTVESRLKYQKHKLINKLKIYDETISAWQNMKNNGYDRIWDCGNVTFRWEKD